MPSATARPPTVPRTPLPVTDSKASARRDRHAALDGALHDRRGQRDARCRARASRPAAAARSPADRRRRRPTTSFGFPSVSVPVLSTTSVSTLRSTSIASAFLNRTPTVAPLPVATMIDIGVARPSAHGQAMIRTATALTSACARRGSGPSHGPHDERDDGDRDHRRHEVRRRRRRRAAEWARGCAAPR